MTVLRLLLVCFWIHSKPSLSIEPNFNLENAEAQRPALYIYQQRQDYNDLPLYWRPISNNVQQQTQQNHLQGHSLEHQYNRNTNAQAYSPNNSIFRPLFYPANTLAQYPVSNSLAQTQNVQFYENSYSQPQQQRSPLSPQQLEQHEQDRQQQPHQNQDRSLSQQLQAQEYKGYHAYQQQQAFQSQQKQNLANTGPHTFPLTTNINANAAQHPANNNPRVFQEHPLYTTYAHPTAAYAQQHILAQRSPVYARNIQSARPNPSTHTLNQLEAPFKPSPFLDYAPNDAAATPQKGPAELSHHLSNGPAKSPFISMPLMTAAQYYERFIKPIYEKSGDRSVPPSASGQPSSITPLIYLSPNNSYDLFRSAQ